MGTTFRKPKPTIARIKPRAGVYIYNSAVWIRHSFRRPAIPTNRLSSAPLFLQAAVFWLQRKPRHLALTPKHEHAGQRASIRPNQFLGQHLSTKHFFLFESTLERGAGQRPTLMTYLLWHFVRTIPGGVLAGWLSPFGFVRETQGEFFAVHLFNSVDFFDGRGGGVGRTNNPWSNYRYRDFW